MASWMHRSTPTTRHWLAPALVLMLTLSLTAFAWHRVRKTEDVRELERFEDEVGMAYVTINRVTVGYVTALRLAQSVVEMERELTPEMWQKLLHGYGWQKRFPA